MKQINLKNPGITISLVHDLFLDREGAIWVTSDKEYVNICKLLAEAEEGSPSLTVLVRQKVHYLWIEHFSNQIGRHAIFTEKTARDLLSDAWKASLPEWLDDKTILAQNLLEIKALERMSPDFVSAILVILVGKIFEVKILDPECLVEFLENLIDPGTREALIKYPVLKRCLAEKCQEWSVASVSPWIKEVLPEMLEDSNRVWKNLSIWYLLSGYPEKLIEYAMPLSQAVTVKKVPPKVLRQLRLNRVGVQQAIDQIEFYFKEIQGSISSNQEFKDLINRVSGRLNEEFKFLVSLLESNKFTPEKEDIELIQRKFKDCPGLSSMKLTSLMNLVPVAEPPTLAPGETWDFNKWVLWAIREYLPFRQWSVNQKQGNLVVEGTVQRFTDWYITNYTSLHQNNEISLTHTLNYWKPSIDLDDLTFIVLIDCLPANYWAILEDCLRKAGFFQHQTGYRLAPLPSDTKNNKPLLISGNWETGGNDYRQLFAQRVMRDWPQKEFFYQTSLKELMEMECPTIPAVVALNFYLTDDVLHSDVGAKGSTYEEELQRLIMNLGETLKSFTERWTGDPKKLSVYIITDHGATRLLDEETKSFDAKMVNKLFPIEKYRYGQVKENEADQIPQNLWEFGYRFKPPFFPESSLFFIPRGHNTVKTGGVGSYKHGGATPEEVIVPIGIFKSSPLPWKNPGLRLLGVKVASSGDRTVFYVQRLTTITIEVQNNNPEPLKINRVEILNPPCDLKDYEKPAVSAHSQVAMKLDCYFSGKARQETELVIEVGYEAQGEERAVLIKVPAEFNTAVTGGFNLKEFKAN